jgi:uncharacterized protein YbjT (DUF2867 family)
MILVTGASGSNGSEIVRRLSERGVAVRAMVRTPSDQAKDAVPGVESVRATSTNRKLSGVSWAACIAHSW